MDWTRTHEGQPQSLRNVVPSPSQQRHTQLSILRVAKQDRLDSLEQTYRRQLACRELLVIGISDAVSERALSKVQEVIEH